MNFSQAIAREEGWSDPDSRCRRNHNPGNVEYGVFAKAHGAISGDPRFAVFPDDATGFAAVVALLMEGYVGLNVSEAIEKWAPEVENDTSQYVLNVCHWCGISPSTVLTAEML